MIKKIKPKGLEKFDKTKKKDPKTFVGAVKPTSQSQKTTRKQNKARYTNVHNKASANTELGKKIRSMLYDMTKDTKYNEKNFQKNLKVGDTYSLSDIRSSLSFAKKKAVVNAKKQHKRLVTVQKRQGHITTYTEFRKANPQYTKKRVDVKKARKEYNKLHKLELKNKLRKTSYKDFKKANPHILNPLSGFDTADVEAFYDS